VLTTGTTGYSVTTNCAFTEYTDGLQITIKANHTNVGAVALSANEIGGKNIRKIVRGGSDVVLVDGDIQKDGIYDLRYDEAANSAAGAWILMNPALSAAALTAIGTSGATIPLLNGVNIWSGNNSILAMGAINQDSDSSPSYQFRNASSEQLATVRYDSPNTRLDLFARDAPAGNIVSRLHLRHDGIINVQAGVLQEGGVPVVTTTGTQTLTNKTINAVAPLQEGGVDVAKVSTASEIGQLNFPIGHMLQALNGASNPVRNESRAVFIHNSQPDLYVLNGHPNAGNQLAGTWRSSGGDTSQTDYLMRRVA
jgi:hypothetical protein